MSVVYEAVVETELGKKSISVVSGDVLSTEERIDVLTTSAFTRDYSNTQGSMFYALAKAGIDVSELAHSPYIDIRRSSGVWLSDELTHCGNIKRIGCVEMGGYEGVGKSGNLRGIRAYFRMLDVAIASGTEIEVLAMPLLGGGDQGISADLTVVPIIRECVSFLRRNDTCKKILFVDINPERAGAYAEALKKLYSILDSSEIKVEEKKPPLAFISYSSKDKAIADVICEKLEAKSVKVWYAPRNVSGSYADSIMKGIRSATHFIVILSRNSMSSQHVLNEIDNAFKRLPNDIIFKPLRLDDIELTEAFEYYLSRQHRMDAILPPIDEKLDAFVKSVAEDN